MSFWDRIFRRKPKDEHHEEGREGVSIAIRQSCEILEKSPDNLYDDQLMIYQQYIPLPKTTIQTETGPPEVNLVHNCFVVAGEPSAIGVRGACKLILDDNSYFIPVCCKSDN